MSADSPLEKLFYTRATVRVLEVMLRKGELNVSELVKLTALSHDSVIRGAGTLCELGVIREKRFGRIRIYQLVSDSKIVRAVRNLEEELGSTRTQNT